MLVAVGLELPLVAWLVGRWAFGLEGQDLFVAVVLAGLPSAQVVSTCSQRSETAVDTIRDSVLVTTMLSAPALVVVAALLASAPRTTRGGPPGPPLACWWC